MKKEFTIEYCPTEIMLADYYTKPLQGELFRRFRRVLMGWDHIDTLRQFLEQSKERVGNVDFHPKLKKELKPSYADVTRSYVENQMRNTECKVAE